jgi:glycosyltransferase involved in cell wall biosynthesis
MTQVAPRDIGVVAIGRNEGKRLIDCLKSVRFATANIVYVDSGSTDGSVIAAEKLGARVVKLDLARPFTAARARNEGFETLNTLWPNIRFVQFIDGDCTLAQPWIDKALDFMEQRADVAIACGRRRERYPTASIYNRILDDEWNTPIGEATACGGDTLVRVEAFERVGGFRPWLIAGEEPELCVRLREDGWKIWRLNEEMTQHDAAMHSFAQWWVRSVRSGYGFAEVSRLHRASPHVTWGREITRAIFWAGFLPLVIVAGGLIHPFALWLALAYPLQVFRLGIRRGAASPESWWDAILSVPAKFAQLEGILKFYWRSWRQQTTQLIEYKKL